MLKVTKPITSNGRYYKAGEIVDMGPNEGVFHRLYGWVYVDDKPAGESVTGLRKAELLHLADERGVEVPAGATKKDIIDLLGE